MSVELIVDVYLLIFNAILVLSISMISAFESSGAVCIYLLFELKLFVNV